MEPIWTPSDEVRERSNALRLARRLGFDGYHDLHRFSVEEPEEFWPAVVEDLGLEFAEPWQQVVDTSRGEAAVGRLLATRIAAAEAMLATFSESEREKLAEAFGEILARPEINRYCLRRGR